MTQTKLPPENPGRFKMIGVADLDVPDTHARQLHGQITAQTSCPCDSDNSLYELLLRLGLLSRIDSKKTTVAQHAKAVELFVIVSVESNYPWLLRQHGGLRE